MKFLTLAVVAIFMASASFSQTDSIKHRRKPLVLTPPPAYQHSTHLAPQRGKKDLRPKQFPQRANASWARVDLSSTLKNIRQLNVGNKTAFPVAELPSLNAVLVRKQQGDVSSSYSFRVENEAYKGAFIFINTMKDRTTGETKYVGHFIRRGYSDALKLKTENGKIFFAVDAHENVVQD